MRVMLAGRKFCTFSVRTRHAARGRSIVKLARLGLCIPARSTNQHTGFRLNFEGMFEPGYWSEVMTGCLLVGASYALLNTQTHVVGAAAAVGVEDSKVRAIESVVFWSRV